MCGIIGYSGGSPAFPYLYEGLKRLEYRGYDSVGVCISGKVVKMKGNVDGLLKSEVFLNNCGSFGIGHTRWATHGEPSFVNSHPQTSHNLHIVHNGIIENYMEIKERLQRLGYEFLSQTDTEVAAHLLHFYYQGDLLKALLRASKDLKGSYAILAMSDKEGELAAVRKESPLVIGQGKSGVHLASDIAAVADKCDKLYVLLNNEFVTVKEGGISFFDSDGNPLYKKPEEIDKGYESVTMDGYATFMEKEIEEGARSVYDTVKGINFDNLPEDFFTGIENVCFCACGTAYHACCYGKKLLERFVKIPVSVEIASELKEQYLTADSRTLFVFISQSGETADTLSAHALAKKAGAKTLAVTNVSRSSLEEVADACVKTRAGREYAVASTKAYLSQLAFCLCFTEALCKKKGFKTDLISDSLLKNLCAALKKVSKLEEIEILAKLLKDEQHAYFLGRGLDYLTAMEASLKLKEITYIHSEAYPAGELKHGTLALIEKGTKIIAFITQEELKDKMLSNLCEVKARGAHVTLLTKFPEICGECDIDAIINLPALDDIYMPLISIVPCQRLAFSVSTVKGINCDKPRNLAKSVTVE